MSDTAFVGEVPAYYDRNLGPFLFEPFAHHLASLLAARNPKDILELACGTGIPTRAIKDALPDARLTATDLNAPMIEIARGKFPAGDVEFSVADAQALSYEDASFDAVVCQFGVMFFPDKALAAREAFRVLRKGGSYVFSCWDSLERNSYAKTIHQLLQEDLQPDPPEFLLVPYGYCEPETISAGVEDAGFRQVEVHRVSINSTSDSALTVATGFCYGTPLAGALQERPEVSASRFRDKLADRLGAAYGVEPMKVTLNAFVCTAIKP